MNLKEKIDRELNRQVSQGSAGEIDVTVQAGSRLHCRLTAVDSIACAFEQFALETDKLAGSSLDELKKLSEDLCQRLSYLLEPIQPIELDADGCTVQMRSNPPQKDETGTSYYELLARRGGQLSLSRYGKTPRQTRQVIPASVTREVFQRLAADFTEAVE